MRDTYSGGSIVANDRLYYLTDANSNVTAVVGFNQSAGEWQNAESYAYDPYGAVTVYTNNWTTVAGYSLAASTVGNTLGFASMSFDPATGLYNDEARWYSTATSGFVSRDPAQSTSNLYCYCGDEPVDRVHPNGCSPVLLTKLWEVAHTAIVIKEYVQLIQGERVD